MHTFAASKSASGILGVSLSFCSPPSVVSSAEAVDSLISEALGSLTVEGSVTVVLKSGDVTLSESGVSGRGIVSSRVIESGVVGWEVGVVGVEVVGSEGGSSSAVLVRSSLVILGRLIEFLSQSKTVINKMNNMDTVAL